MCKQKSNTFFKQKKKKNCGYPSEREKKKKKKHLSMDPCPLAREHFFLTMCFIFSPLVFSPFGGENILAGPERKNPAPTISFPSPSSQPNTLQQVFTPHFLSLFLFYFFHLPQNSLYQTHYKTRQNKKLREREREL